MLGNKANLSPYVLLTAASNEESLIDKTIESVLSQTVLPARWVIVSDGSTDRTDEIVQRYCMSHAFLRFLRVEQAQERGTPRKVNALRLAYEELRDTEYQFIGNLDADVSLVESYYETLVDRLRIDPTLGIAGGLVYEPVQGEFRTRLANSVTSVAHAAQLVRRECYEAIGGYLPLKYGGEDWCSEVSARMRGWAVRAFPDLRVMHHRRTGAANWALRHRFCQGKMDFSFGSHPVFELLKCMRRVPEWPFGVGALLRLVGFFSSYTAGEPRLVPPEVAQFVRSEQKHRLQHALSRFLGAQERPHTNP